MRAQLPIIRRDQYIGRTDRYMGAPMAYSPAQQAQLANVGTTASSVVGSILGDSYVRNSTDRLSRYDEFWNYYSGRHFAAAYDGLFKKLATNFCRRIVNKRATWATGKDISFLAEKGNELVAEFFTSFWEFNDVEDLVWRTQVCSLVSGDAFWFVNLITKDRFGNLLPRERWTITVNLLNPKYCFPAWSESNPHKLSSIVVEFPFQKYNAGSPMESMFSLHISDTEVVRYEDGVEVGREVNPLGVVNVIHVPNYRVADQPFGNSELEDLIPLNDAYNEIQNSVRRIINYAGEPTTVVYGAKLSQMERAVNKVWSGLPAEGKVENLVLPNSALDPFTTELKRLETQIYSTGKTPRISFDSEGLAISNTSGVAMALLFQPLIEASVEAQRSIRRAFAATHAVVARIHERIFGQSLTMLADDPENALSIYVDFASLLPRDEAAFMELAVRKLESKAWSQAEFIRQVSGVKDSKRLALELVADKRAEWADQLNKFRALNGVPVNESAAFLGSPFMNEELLDVARKIEDIDAAKGAGVSQSVPVSE